MQREDEACITAKAKYKNPGNSVVDFTAAEFIFCGCFVIIKKNGV